jgi:hypothetical protein
MVAIARSERPRGHGNHSKPSVANFPVASDHEDRHRQTSPLLPSRQSSCCWIRDGVLALVYTRHQHAGRRVAGALPRRYFPAARRHLHSPIPASNRLSVRTLLDKKHFSCTCPNPPNRTVSKSIQSQKNYRMTRAGDLIKAPTLKLIFKKADVLL